MARISSFLTRRKRWIQALIMLLLAASIAIILLYMIPRRYRLTDEVIYQVDDRMTDNPLMGYAPMAENVEQCARTNLVFIRLRWADWEPKEGQYDVHYLEENFHIEEYKKEKKHAVLRFVCDLPGQTAHKDIPEWLAAKTGGAAYSNAYGKGYQPDYENDKFIAYHEKAIKALADYCNRSDFVAFVELGSLGHWGEWHCDSMPAEETLWNYVLAYTDQFHNAQILMRRNYAMAQEGKLGLYNDMLGAKEETKEWLSWIKDGGSQTTGQGEILLKAMPDYWKEAAVGGELTSEISQQDMLDSQLGEVSELISDCHLSFIGPNCPVYDQNYAAGYEALKKRVGYRIYVSRLKTKFNYAKKALEVQLDWENDGQAPFYLDWPVMMKVFDKNGKLLYWESLDLKLSELLPGKTITSEASIPFSDAIAEGFEIGLSITDYEENENITLAIEYNDEADESSSIPAAIHWRENAQIIYSWCQTP